MTGSAENTLGLTLDERQNHTDFQIPPDVAAFYAVRNAVHTRLTEPRGDSWHEPHRAHMTVQNHPGALNTAIRTQTPLRSRAQIVNYAHRAHTYTPLPISYFPHRPNHYWSVPMAHPRATSHLLRIVTGDEDAKGRPMQWNIRTAEGTYVANLRSATSKLTPELLVFNAILNRRTSTPATPRYDIDILTGSDSAQIVQELIEAQEFFEATA